MDEPVMGDHTPRTKVAMRNAEKSCPTDSHKYGYMLSFAQGLELEIAELRKHSPEGRDAKDAARYRFWRSDDEGIECIVSGYISTFSGEDLDQLTDRLMVERPKDVPLPQ